MPYPTAENCGRTCGCEYAQAGDLCDFGERLAESRAEEDRRG